MNNYFNHNINCFMQFCKNKKMYLITKKYIINVNQKVIILI